MSDCAVEILLVESDAALADMIARTLESAIWCRVTLAETASAALREELTAQHDLILLSSDLPDDEDFSLLRQVRVTNDCPIVVLAGATSIEKLLESIRH